MTYYNRIEPVFPRLLLSARISAFRQHGLPVADGRYALVR
jgi:hypothetical protein